MDLCLELTSYAFQLAPFVCCCYRKCMEGAWWDIYSKENRRHTC
jgi:hypothetical protein